MCTAGENTVVIIAKIVFLMDKYYKFFKIVGAVTFG